MRHHWAYATCCVALAVLTGQPNAAAEDRPIRRITVTVAREVAPFAGIIMHPLPPNTASQRIVSWEMFVKTSKRTTKAEARLPEAGPFKKPILTVAADPDEKMRLVLELEIDLYQAPGPVTVGRLAPTLTNEERTGYTAAGLEYEHDAEAFRVWIEANGLVKGKTESDVQFAVRLLAFMRTKFIYKGPDENYKRKKIAERGSGELGFFTSEWSGECLALSRIYVCALRANGVPSRMVSGWMLEGGHHVRAEVFLEQVGWIHVELAGSITNKSAHLAEFFGRGGSYMIVMNVGINYALPGPSGLGNIGTFDGFAFCKKVGDWEVPRTKLIISNRTGSKAKRSDASVAAPQKGRRKATISAVRLQVDRSGWVSLFNGRDLAGWKTHPFDNAKWAVKNGILIGSGPYAGHLFSQRDDFKNFHFKVEAKINDAGNGGQYFRTKFGKSFPQGYEAQINSTGSDPVKTGSLFDRVPVQEKLVQPDEWFTQEVIALGNHIVILVNGTKVVDYVDPANTYTTGHLALQHSMRSQGKDTVVQFRKILVRELPEIRP